MYRGHRGIASVREEVYQTFYDTFLEYEPLFHRFWENPHTEVWAERCVGMLGTYSTSLRQCGECVKAAEVLAADFRVLARYRDMTRLTAPDKR